MEPGHLEGQLRADLRTIGESVERAEALAGPFADFSELLAEWARRMNLTGFRDPVDIARRLVLPPLIWSRLLPTRPVTIADVGSGAGVPGIPLALAFPDAEVVLVESRERRHYFQRQAIRSLGLARTVALLGRAEELEARECELGVAQALAPLPEAVFHVKRWTQIGGVVAIPHSDWLPAVDDPDLAWIDCPKYRDPFDSQPSFLWMSRRDS